MTDEEILYRSGFNGTLNENMILPLNVMLSWFVSMNCKNFTVMSIESHNDMVRFSISGTYKKHDYNLRVIVMPFSDIFEQANRIALPCMQFKLNGNIASKNKNGEYIIYNQEDFDKLNFFIQNHDLAENTDIILYYMEQKDFGEDGNEEEEFFIGAYDTKNLWFDEDSPVYDESRYIFSKDKNGIYTMSVLIKPNPIEKYSILDELHFDDFLKSVG